MEVLVSKTGIVRDFFKENLGASNKEAQEHFRNTTGGYVDQTVVSKVRKELGISIFKSVKLGKRKSPVLSVIEPTVIEGSTKGDIMENFFKENSGASNKTAQEYCKKVTGSYFDQGDISRLRKKLGIPVSRKVKKKSRVKKQMNFKNVPDYMPVTKDSSVSNIVRHALRENPNFTYEKLRQYVSKIKRIKLSPLNGTMVKKIKIELSNTPAPVQNNTESQEARTRVSRKVSRLYLTIWSYPVDKMDIIQKTLIKEILSSFIEEMNSGGSKFEIVERTNPDMIEVRESKSRA